MTQRKWNAIYVAAIIFSSATISALVSGEIGYRRGLDDFRPTPDTFGRSMCFTMGREIESVSHTLKPADLAKITYSLGEPNGFRRHRLLKRTVAITREGRLHNPDFVKPVKT